MFFYWTGSNLADSLSRLYRLFHLARCGGVCALFLLYWIVLPKEINAQVVINEFSSDTSDDWVELFSPEDVDISGWLLKDSGTSTAMETVAIGTIIGPSNSIHLSFNVGKRLNKSGDVITLISTDGVTVVDEIPYGDKGGVCLPTASGSAGRYPDGSSTVERFSVNTKGATNDSAILDLCPTPTPTSSPTDVPQPTDSPSPTQEPTATNVPTPFSTKVPTKKPSETPEPTMELFGESENKTEGEVLGKKASESGSSKNKEEENSNFPKAALFLIGGGVLFIGTAGYFMYVQRKDDFSKESNNIDEKDNEEIY